MTITVPFDGILLMHKPLGMTSHDVVHRVRRELGIKKLSVKVGHAGTLDPLAEGLLVVLVGRAATRRQGEFLFADKEYEATIRFGANSATDDSEGPITPVSCEQPMTRGEVDQALTTFIGEISQMPPAFCARKVAGERAYALARKGIVPELKPKLITIREIEVLSYAWPVLRVRVVCTSGTYVRSLARDLGARLQCGGYLEALVRTRVGSLTLANAVPVP